jgi:hypothetical protein
MQTDNIKLHSGDDDVYDEGDLFSFNPQNQ